MYFEHWEIKDGQKLILSLPSLNFIFVRDPGINQIITKLMEKVVMNTLRRGHDGVRHITKTLDLFCGFWNGL